MRQSKTEYFILKANPILQPSDHKMANEGIFIPLLDGLNLQFAIGISQNSLQS